MPSMAEVEVSYTEARARLAELLDRVADDREVVRIHRQRGTDAVLLDADEYASLAETAHLLSSPANARQLLLALFQADAGDTRSFESVDQLWAHLDASDESEDDQAGAPQPSPTVDLMAALKASLGAAKRSSERQQAREEAPAPEQPGGPTSRRA